MSSTKSKPLLSQRNRDLIAKFLLGGAALGGGTALTTSLINYLHHLHQDKAEKDDDTLYIHHKPKKKDDDTLYVYRKPKEDDEGVKAASVGGGLAIAGGLLSTVGSYALVKQLYATLRKREAQATLDAAQRAFLNLQGYEVADKKKKNSKDSEKKASAEGKPMSILEGLTSIPVALPILLAIGAGVTSHAMLNKAFPVATVKVKPPRRIEIVEPPADETEKKTPLVNKPTEPLEKPAFVKEEDGLDFLLRMLVIEKNASSDVSNLVAAVANGAARPFKGAVETVGYMDALDLVKGASSHTVDPLAEHIAISYLAKSSRLSPATGIIAAAEFADKHPHFFKLAGALPQDIQDKLYDITQMFGHAVRSELTEEFGIPAPSQMDEIEKYAFTDEAIEALLEAVAARTKPVAKGDSDESSATSGEEAGEQDLDSPSRKSPVKLIATSKTGRGALAKIPADEIDKILTPRS